MEHLLKISFKTLKPICFKLFDLVFLQTGWFLQILQICSFKFSYTLLLKAMPMCVMMLNKIILHSNLQSWISNFPCYRETCKTYEWVLKQLPSKSPKTKIFIVLRKLLQILLCSQGYRKQKQLLIELLSRVLYIKHFFLIYNKLPFLPKQVIDLFSIPFIKLSTICYLIMENIGKRCKQS